MDEILKFIKEKLKYQIIIFLTSLLILLLPNELLELLHLKHISNDYWAVIGISLLISSISIIISILIIVKDLFLKLYNYLANIIKLKKRLKNLDNEEKAVIREFYGYQRNTLDILMTEATVSGLLKSNILEITNRQCYATGVGTVCPISISEFAKKYITRILIGLPIEKASKKENIFLNNHRAEYALMLGVNEKLEW